MQKGRVPRFFWICMTVLAVAIIVSLFFIWNASRDDDHGVASLKAVSAYVEGTIEYVRLGSTGNLPQNFDLQEGDMIKTGDNGKAILSLDDGSVLRLNNNTEVELTSLHPNSIVITNKKGEVYSRIADLERSFEVKIDEYSMKSLGTAYLTKNMDSEKGVEVFESSVEFKKADESKTIEQGKEYYFVKDGKENNEIGELNLDDLKEDEFVVWNRSEDLKLEDFKNKMGFLQNIDGVMLEISTPKNEATTEDSEILVEGKTDTDAKVYINDTEVTNTDGKFSQKIALEMGENKINVRAENSLGHKNEKSLKVTRRERAQEQNQESNQQQQQGASISLSGSATDDGINFSWTVTGVDISQGFKLVKSESASPVYPGNDYQYLSDNATRSYKWSIQDGKTYHFRVCQYLGGSCGVYSNNITVTAPKKEQQASGVDSIALSYLGSGKISWSVNGYSESGFKVVWSKNKNPTYPTRADDKYLYYNSATVTGSSVNAFDGAGKYYVRVCEYLGGACGVYSNQISITLE